MKLKVVDLDNKAQGDITLNDAVFAAEVRKDILDRVIQWQLAKRRAGTHQTKNISAVQGTTRKPWRQKGTGRARAGTLRAVQFRKGAVAHGPQSRDHGYSLQKKVRKMGLCAALSAKHNAGKLIIVDSLQIKAPKTSDMKKKLENMNLSSVLFIDAAAIDQNFGNAISNLIYVDALPVIGANVYDIIRHDALVLTKEAVKSLEERLV